MGGRSLGSSNISHPSTPVGVMTGWDEQEITARMRGGAMDFVMFKPFSFRDMLKTVARILEAKP